MYGLYGCSKQPPPLLPPLPQPLAPTPARCRRLLSHCRRRNRCRCRWNTLLLLPAFPALASMQPQLLALPLTLPSMPLPQEAFLDFASMEALPLPLSRSMPLPPPLPPPGATGETAGSPPAGGPPLPPLLPPPRAGAAGETAKNPPAGGPPLPPPPLGASGEAAASTPAGGPPPRC